MALPDPGMLAAVPVVLMQISEQASDANLRVDPAWLITTGLALVSSLTGTIAFLYRGQIAALKERIVWLEGELQKRDEREDRLIGQVAKQADLLDRDVTLHEKASAQR